MSRERHGRKCSPVRERILDSSSNDDWETLFESSATDKGTWLQFIYQLYYPLVITFELYIRLYPTAMQWLHFASAKRTSDQVWFKSLKQNMDLNGSACRCPVGKVELEKKRIISFIFEGWYLTSSYILKSRKTFIMKRCMIIKCSLKFHPSEIIVLFLSLML